MSTTPPIAFFTFNRPEPTTRVFEAIRRARPSQLMLISDGPRVSRENEANAVREVRDIISRVDWPCDVSRNFSSENLGCKCRIVSGLKWVFEQVEEAIILEDDCLPTADFFPYCEALLKRYRHDERVGSIGGINPIPRDSSASYYFSKYFHCWGWATWKRSWQTYDANMKTWPKFREQKQLENIADHGDEAIYWRKIFNAQHAGEIDSWDYAWQYASLASGRLNVTPSVNLVSNIGFGAEATHTSSATDELGNQAVSGMPEIEHPTFLTRHKTADLQIFLKCHLRRYGLQRTLWRWRNRAA